MSRGPALALQLLVASTVLFAPALAAEDKKKPMANHKITQAVSYVGLDPIYTTVMDEGRPAGLLLVSVGLDIPSEQLRAETNTALPVLRDAYVRSLMTFTAAAVRPDEQPDVDLIARRLQAVTDRELRKPGARLLLGQVFMRIKP